MLLTVAEFRSRVTSSLPALVHQLQEVTGRQNPDEADAWRSSLTKVSEIFGAPAFQQFHLYFGDLKWRDGKWKVVSNEVHETGLVRTVQRARREKILDGPQQQALLTKVLQSYRILLTRALRGVYVWFEDRQTRDHILESLART
ncbi:MAG TPA: hypothetical protein DCY13_22965 [Verrucomicrobiales bacterium]|nr:hypothetical protein [Verrucomicrobiales bacterium]